MHGLAGDSGANAGGAHPAPLSPPGPGAGDDAGLAIRAAWLYHAGGFTQSEVAAKLGVTSAKAHRLIGRATRAGLVRVFVEGPIGDCIAHEAALTRQYGLTMCRVVPSLDEIGLPLRALGIAAAIFLRETLERGEHTVIGVGHGRTLAALVDHLPRVPCPGLQVVSLLGGMPRRNPAHPFEVIDRLAEKTDAEAHLLPVPMFAREARDRDVLRRQTGVAEALALTGTASLLILGIGEVAREAFLAQAGAFAAADLDAARAAGAAGEALGYFYDAQGRLVDTALHARVTGLPLPELSSTPAKARRDVVAVAGGAGKTHAINAVLRSRLLSGLITDELTARQLVAEHP